MRSFVTPAALLGALVLGACGGQAESASVRERTDDTTQDLLTSISDDEGGVPVTGAPPQRPTVDVAVLGFDRGSKAAPVRVVEMSDYGCGYCRQFHQETWPMIAEKFIGAGKIEWKFVPFVNGMFANSPVATEAAECALEQGPELFEAVNGSLWENQSAWKGSDDPAPVVRAFAQQAGADMGRFDSCIAEDRRVERIAASTELARQIGVRGTPTFFVVGYPPIQGALPTETFEQVLNMVYAEATGAGGD